MQPDPLPQPEKRRAFTAREVASVFIKYDARCAHCSEKVKLGEYAIDHIQALDHLGKHELDNWQLLCTPCHIVKTKRDVSASAKGRRIRKRLDVQQCSVDWCDRPVRSAGLCRRHHQRQWRYGNPEAGGRYQTAPGEKQAFIQAVLKQDTDECVEWSYPYNTGTGYADISWDGRGTYAHRVMCILAHGEPSSPKLVAAHSCGNRRCMNPKHLRWATYAENEADKHRHGTSMKGKPGRMIKLTEEDLIAIRNLRGVKSQREIAEQYGVHQVTVSEIQTGKYGAWAGNGRKRPIPSRGFQKRTTPHKWPKRGFGK